MLTQLLYWWGGKPVTLEAKQRSRVGGGRNLTFHHTKYIIRINLTWILIELSGWYEMYENIYICIHWLQPPLSPCHCYCFHSPPEYPEIQLWHKSRSVNGNPCSIFLYCPIYNRPNYFGPQLQNDTTNSQKKNCPKLKYWKCWLVSSFVIPQSLFVIFSSYFKKS